MAKPLALVTGAGIGIGQATALALGKAGYHVIVTDILEKEGRATARRIGSAEFHAMDVTDTKAVNAVVAAVEKKHKRGLAAVVNNAGIAKKLPTAKLTDADWDMTHEVDLKGMMRVVRAAAPGMRKKGGGIVCLSSIAGYTVGWADHVPYTAAKGGIAGLVKGFAIDLAPFGIRVNGIAPGLIRSAQSLDPVHSVGAKGLQAMVPRVPLGRIGTPADIADVVVFLLSDQSRYITGQVLTVDGGMTVAL
jgi:3-oxoacyl-[acyl-carrier protein] reductase